MKMIFPPDRTAALERLSDFLPRAGADYARLRNHDLGAEGHPHVSRLSPYLRHRLITEEEVLRAVLGRHSLQAAEKFVQEVVWRTYWKGWLEMRPGVWAQYRAGLVRALDRVAAEGGLRAAWEAACRGETGIDCFDHWARELVETGYLHNHARMWFASIWIFTLRLPWELGADFFLRHLLDGDAASNTLGWRWVGGLQTRGKTYLARPDNIARYTGGRFAPHGQLAEVAPPLNGPELPPRRPAPQGQAWDPALKTGLLLTSEDLSPGFLFDRGLKPVATLILHAPGRISPLAPAPHVSAFSRAALGDAARRWAGRLGEVTGPVDSADALMAWALATGVEQIVTAHPPVGPVADLLAEAEALLPPEIPLVRSLRVWDGRAWPHATHGFFRFREKIPALVGPLLP